MIVFGDRVRTAEPVALLSRLRDRVAGIDDMQAGIVRHAALAGALLNAGELAQGLADEALGRTGRDDNEAPAPARVVRRLAAALLASWRSDFTVIALAPVRAALAGISGTPWPDEIRVRTPEGFAFYAVYPEAYAEAARQAGGPARVIGLRTIGVVLAHVVAEAIGAAPPHTVRPVGHPFARTIALSDRLATDIAADPDVPRLIVDEGPGASGSSFGAVADWLEQAGVAPGRICFLPSHAGPPGPMASDRNRARWDRTRRVSVSFDTLSLQATRPAHRLENWFADLVGPAIAPLVDISGGAWRSTRVPCIPGFERRKFLLRTDAGAWLLKFSGLGSIGESKLAVARDLHSAGFSPEPVGLRHGFLIERWHDDAQPIDRATLLPVLGRYIAHRARYAADDAEGASLATLCDMARHNTREALGEETAGHLTLDATRAAGARVRVDGRLHHWEWIGLADGRVLKTDALDHHAGHDLIGCQDMAWDIAGGIVEFDLTAGEADSLCAVIARAGVAIDRRLIATHILCYSAFQLGLWQQGVDADPALQRYRRRLSSPPYRP